MYSNFAPVAPIGVLEELDRVNMCPEYHLLLAHEVLKDPERWSAFFEGRRQGGHIDFIIMDNSLWELGHPLPAPDLVKAVEVVKANTLVLPDKLSDRNTTVRMSTEGYKELSDVLPSYSSFLVVAQGESVQESVACVADIVAGDMLGKIKFISAPRIFTERYGSRAELVKALRNEFPELLVHLLGFSNDMADDFLVAETAGVLGIDSATPIWLGQQGRVLKTSPYRNYQDWMGKRPKDYMESTNITPEVIANLHRVYAWLGVYV